MSDDSFTGVFADVLAESRGRDLRPYGYRLGEWVDFMREQGKKNGLHGYPLNIKLVDIIVEHAADISAARIDDLPPERRAALVADAGRRIELEQCYARAVAVIAEEVAEREALGDLLEPEDGDR